MKTKAKLGCATGILTICISMPMWYWLLYQILKHVGASETMWLVYYIYIPFGFVMMIVNEIIKSVFDDEK